MEKKIKAHRILLENTKSDQLPTELDREDQLAQGNFYEKEKTKVNKRKADRIKFEERKDEEDRQKFIQVLDRCVEILISTMNSGGDFFELLDPLISDNQCHIHSVLILDVLRKCYDSNDRTFCGIEELEDKDKKILSYAVLFSLLKVQCKDKLGFVVHEISIRDFNSLMSNFKKRERHYIFGAREAFNSYSVEHIKSVASENIKEIFIDCEATSGKLKSLPCYPSINAVIDCIRGHKLPIIVPLVSVNTRVVGKDIKYNIHSREVRFYEYQEDRDGFYYKRNISDYEKNLPTVAFNCYRLITNGTPEIAVDQDLTELLMLNAASHWQLPKNAELPSGYESGDEYVRELYGKQPVVYQDFNHYYELGKRYNLINARYSRCVAAPLEEGGEKSLIIERRKKEIFFAVEHIYLSNYSREYQNTRKHSDYNTQLDETEVFKINVKIMTLEALGWLNSPKNA